MAKCDVPWSLPRKINLRNNTSLVDASNTSQHKPDQRVNKSGCARFCPFAVEVVANGLEDFISAIDVYINGGLRLDGWSSVHAPIDGGVREDDAGAARVGGAGDDLSG